MTKSSRMNDVEDFISHNSTRNGRSRESESARKSFVSLVLGKVRRAVVQLLLSLKFFHSLGVYPCSFCLCVVLLFYKVALPVQVRKQFNFCQISHRLNTVQ